MHWCYLRRASTEDLAALAVGADVCMAFEVSGSDPISGILAVVRNVREKWKYKMLRLEQMNRGGHRLHICYVDTFRWWHDVRSHSDERHIHGDADGHAGEQGTDASEHAYD